eukprot:m.429150 g.429150  ORF g.429150 m.429150 type:complete len:172 (+) comp16965_c0_seq1:91-606(+)
MFKAVLALTVATLAATAEARWTGNVLVYNLLQNRTLEWVGANATGKQGDATSTIIVKPFKVTEPQGIARFYVDTGKINWDYEGFVWFRIPGYVDDCKKSDLPGPVTSCPWIAWDRVITPITGTEEITWEFETPGQIGIGDVGLTKRIGHASRAYCICEPGVNCQQECAEIN